MGENISNTYTSSAVLLSLRPMSLLQQIKLFEELQKEDFFRSKKWNFKRSMTLLTANGKDRDSTALQDKDTCKFP